MAVPSSHQITGLLQAWCKGDRFALEQLTPPVEAIRAYTWGSAYASFDEKIKGTIEVGKLADFAVLSDDILTIDSARIEKTKVVMTIFDGRVVYDRSSN